MRFEHRGQSYRVQDEQPDGLVIHAEQSGVWYRLETDHELAAWLAARSDTIADVLAKFERLGPEAA